MIGIAAEEIWQFLTSLDCDGCEEHYAHLGIGDEGVKQYTTTSGLTEFNLALCCIRTSPDLSNFLATTKLQAQKSVHDTLHIEALQAAIKSGLKIGQSPSEILVQGMGDLVTTQVVKPAACDGPSSGREDSRQDGQEKASDLCAFLNHQEFDRVSGSIQAFSACDTSARASNSETGCERPRGVLRSTNLHELLQTCSGDRLGDRLSFPERLRLAKLFSVAYFRFHSTGWANSGWNSKGICFQWTNQDDVIFGIKGLHRPYLQSRVCRTSSSDTSNVSESPPIFGLNAASIFNLGVLLLEIGYSMNWDTLRNVCPTQYSNNDLLSAVLQARTLLANGLFDMGRAYRKIVSKLIECAFGNIYDLDDPKHEAAFLEAVVQPLEEEERKLRAFLGPDRP